MKLYPELEKMVDEYAAAMKKKLLVMQKAGYSDYDASHMQGPIEQKLLRNFNQKDWVDVGALAAMRWRFTNQKIQETKNRS